MKQPHIWIPSARLRAVRQSLENLMYERTRRLSRIDFQRYVMRMTLLCDRREGSVVETGRHDLLCAVSVLSVASIKRAGYHFPCCLEAHTKQSAPINHSGTALISCKLYGRPF